MSTAKAPPAAKRSVPLNTVGTMVHEFLQPIQQDYLNDRSQAVAHLAQLRRGAGKAPADVPELWGLTGTERLFEGGVLREEDAARAEAAVHIAVTLYALHQQSHRSSAMHRPGTELGAAVRQLMPGSEIDEPIRQRFVRAGTAATLESLAYRLRETITLLRRAAIPLDYGLLADRLYQWQQPGGRQKVRQAWGRSFHASRGNQDDAGSNTTTECTTDPTTDKDDAS